MKKILLAILVLITAACSSPAPNFFQPVSLKITDEVYPKFRETVLVNQVLLPAENARPQITTLGKENYEVKIDEFNRWGATPERLIQQVINEDLNNMLPNAVIENQTPLRKNFKYAVAVEINEFSGRLYEKATLKASYYIKNKMGKVIKSGRFAKTSEIKGGYADYIPTQSRLLAEMTAVIAGDLVKVR